LSGKKACAESKNAPLIVTHICRGSPCATVAKLLLEHCRGDQRAAKSPSLERARVLRTAEIQSVSHIRRRRLHTRPLRNRRVGQADHNPSLVIKANPFMRSDSSTHRGHWRRLTCLRGADAAKGRQSPHCALIRRRHSAYSPGLGLALRRERDLAAFAQIFPAYSRIIRLFRAVGATTPLSE
jgi:hypothetical protein